MQLCIYDSRTFKMKYVISFYFYHFDKKEG